ncbi:recombinase family protein [Pseudomonas sp. ISL-84]|nr:recombinase family protein [Pseudomonas sp. ISL-84]
MIIIKELFNRGIRVHILNAGLLKDVSIGRFSLHTLLAIAELERNMIVERHPGGKIHCQAA